MSGPGRRRARRFRVLREKLFAQARTIRFPSERHPPEWIDPMKEAMSHRTEIKPEPGEGFAAFRQRYLERMHKTGLRGTPPFLDAAITIMTVDCQARQVSASLVHLDDPKGRAAAGADELLFGESFLLRPVPNQEPGTRN